MQDRLPQSAIFSIENLEAHSQSPWLSRYVMLHTSWHQCNCDNLSLFLIGYRKALPRSIIEQVDPDFVAQARRRCNDHARALAEIFAAILQLKVDLPIMDTDVAICAYHCARLLLYFYRSSSPDATYPTEKAHEHVHLCLNIVNTLFQSSPVTAVLVSLHFIA